MLFSVLTRLLATKQDDEEDSSCGTNCHDNPQHQVGTVASLRRCISASARLAGLSGSLRDFTSSATNITICIILIVIYVFSCFALCAAGVASGVAVMVVYMLPYLTGGATCVTIDVASVIINMLANFTSCCTNIAILITIVIIDVTSHFALCFTLIAGVVAIIVVLMLAGFYRLLRNLTLCAADITVGVIHVVVDMLCGSSCIATNIAICITGVLIGVFAGSVHSFGIAMTTLGTGILGFARLTTGGCLGFLGSVLMSINGALFAANVTFGITQVIILVCTGCSNCLCVGVSTNGAGVGH